MTKRIPSEDEIVRLSAIKQELRVDTDIEDAYIRRLGRTAQRMVENLLNQDILPATYIDIVDGEEVRTIGPSISTDASEVPADLVEAIHLMVVHLYENRDQQTMGIPMTVDVLVQPYKVYV